MNRGADRHRGPCKQTQFDCTVHGVRSSTLFRRVAPGQGARRSQHRDSRRRSRLEQGGKTLHFVLVFNHHESHDVDKLPELRKHCTEAWKAYFKGNSGINYLSDETSSQMDKVCKMLKKRLFLGHPEVEELYPEVNKLSPVVEES